MPPDILDGLRQLGFERIRDVEAQPRAPMTLRFGPVLWRRLDQARGRAQELIEAVRPPNVIEAERNFAEPIAAAETIARYIDILTDELCGALQTRAVGALRINLVIHRVDNRAGLVSIGMAKPVREPRQIKRMLRDKIESIDPGFGIEKMILSAPRVRSLAPVQAGAKPRLDRDLEGRFGSSRYAMEELVAELGAAFLAGQLALPSVPRTDHAPYIASWLRVLKGDSKAIFTAATKAQAAVDYLKSFQIQEERIAA